MSKSLDTKIFETKSALRRPCSRSAGGPGYHCSATTEAASPFVASHPALKRRAIFRTSSGRWVRFSCPLRLRSGQALRDMVGFLGIAPGVETPGYCQDLLRTLGAVRASPLAALRAGFTGRGWASRHCTRRFNGGSVRPRGTASRRDA